MSKRGLGKGLQALIPSKPVIEDQSHEKIKSISIDDILPNPQQPRKNFNDEKIEELANSIKEHGVVQPIVVRPLEKGKYEIVAGERRWRASKLAKCKEIPAVIKELDAKLTTEVSLIENIQRENLNALEESEAYQRLISEFKYTQEKLALRIGKSRSYVTNTLRLLKLPLTIQEFIREGLITSGHARAILSLQDTSNQETFTEEVIKNNLSVRQTEELAKKYNALIQETENLNETKKNTNKTPQLSPILKDIENKFRTLLGTKVKIKNGEKGGRIEIDYYGDEDLERIIQALIPTDDF